MATVTNEFEARDDLEFEAPAGARPTRADYLDLEYHALMSVPEAEDSDEDSAFSRDASPDSPHAGDTAPARARARWI